MGEKNPDDTGLWSRSLKGSGDAFGVLFDRHHDRVFRHALRMTRSRPDAEDVSATAFLELWRRREKVTLVERSVLPWLLVTTTQCAMNLRRSTGRYRRLIAAIPRSPSAADPADEYLNQNPLEGLDEQLALAMRALKPVDLQLFTLVVLEGYGIAAAAGLLKLTPEAAKARLHRARRRVKAELPIRPAAAPVHLVEEGRP